MRHSTSYQKPSTVSGEAHTLDFASIEAGVVAGAPRRLQWYAAYGLLVTLVWLYVTMLRLLALLARNR